MIEIVLYGEALAQRYRGVSRGNSNGKPVTVSASRLEALGLSALAKSVASGTSVELKYGSVVATVRSNDVQLTADVERELLSPAFAQACETEACIVADGRRRFAIFGIDFE